jgi:hypothetical protein
MAATCSSSIEHACGWDGRRRGHVTHLKRSKGEVSMVRQELAWVLVISGETGGNRGDIEHNDTQRAMASVFCYFKPNRRRLLRSKHFLVSNIFITD